MKAMPLLYIGYIVPGEVEFDFTWLMPFFLHFPYFAHV